MPRRNEPVERSCAVTRTVRPVSELIRFVAAPDGGIVADLKRRLPGRGVWVTATKKDVAAAQAKRVFARSLKDGTVQVEGDLAEEVDGLLERTAISALSMARKAGEVVAGFAKVEAALRGDSVIALVHASDAGADGTNKLAAVARARFGDADKCRVIRTFQSAQLDLALGRSNVIHAALLAGGAARNALDRIDDLERFRAGFEETSRDGVGNAVIQD